LLNTRKFTSRRTHRGGFAFGVNAATKQPAENNKRETSEARRSCMATNQTPGAVIRPGAVRGFQFREYADLRSSVKRAGIGSPLQDVAQPRLPAAGRAAGVAIPEDGRSRDVVEVRPGTRTQ
jgi:hypothetical protein